MIRDKQYASFPPADDVQQRKLLSEDLTAPAEGKDAPYDYRKVKRLRIGISILAVTVVALVCVLIFYLIPKPMDLELRMYAVQINSDGTVQNEGQFVLSGSRLCYPGKLKPDVLTVEELSILNDAFYPDSAKLHFTDLDDEGHTFVFGIAVDEELNARHHLMLEISADMQWCVIEWGSKLLVCSTNENFDPNEILAQSLLKTE